MINVYKPLLQKSEVFKRVTLIIVCLMLVSYNIFDFLVNYNNVSINIGSYYVPAEFKGLLNDIELPALPNLDVIGPSSSRPMSGMFSSTDSYYQSNRGVSMLKISMSVYIYVNRHPLYSFFISSHYPLPTPAIY